MPNEETITAERPVTAEPIVSETPAGALVVQDPFTSLTEAPLYDQINSQQLAVIKSNVAKGLNDAEVAYFLELARSLGLNPWANEVWAAKGNGDNAGLLVMVGRDGLLRKAEEFPDYRGYDCGVVYEGDEFFFGEPDPEGKTLRQRAGIRHSSNPAKAQGAPLGAWACAERVGRPVRRFYARLEEYMPTNERKLRYSPWGSQISIMIEKVPISVVHRTLCNISGVYLQEEVDRVISQAAGDSGGLTRAEEWAVVQGIVNELEADAETRERLLVGMAALNELSPGEWGLAKVQMTLPGRLPGELRAQADQIEADVQRLLGERQAPVTREPEPEVQEAVVVDPIQEALAIAADPEDVPAAALSEALDTLRAVSDPGDLVVNGIADLETALDVATTGGEDAPAE